LSDVREILHDVSSRDAMERLWVSWKLLQVRTYLSYMHYWNYFDACTVKNDILKVKNALEKRVYYVEGYTILLSIKIEFGRKIFSTISEILYNQTFRGQCPMQPHIYDRLTSALIIMWHE
jgi:hypothetical protein